MISKLRKISSLYILLLVMSSPGCWRPTSPSMSVSAEHIAARGRVCVVPGRLLSTRMEPQLAVATYQIGEHSNPLYPRVALDVLFYKATTSGTLPTSALLVLVVRPHGRWELLGRDASRSIVPDTPDNRKELRESCRKGHLMPRRDAWLDRETAKAIARKAIGIPQWAAVGTTLQLRRYDLGWVVTTEPAGREVPPGSEITVVVGDDQQVKSVFGGL